MNSDGLDKLLQSKKYRDICPDTVRRVWSECARRYKKPKDAEKAAREILREKMTEAGDFRMPEHWVGTGGTFTTLAAMVKKIPWTDRTCMHGTTVSLREVRSIGEELADMDLEARKKLPGLQPGRADIVVHGICILLAVMDQLGIGEIIVSEWGNLDGYLRRKLKEGKENG